MGGSRRLARLLAAIITAAACAAAICPAGIAATGNGGRLDPSFGRLGTESPIVGQRPPDPYSGPQIAALPSGRLAVLRGRTLKLLDRHGAPVKQFGSGGSVSTDAVLGVNFSPSSIAVDARGRILVAGLFEGESESEKPEGAPTDRISEYLGEVARFTGHGALDPSFRGDGVGTYDFDFEPPEGLWMGGRTFKTTVPEVGISGVAVGSTGQVALTGWHVISKFGCKDNPNSFFSCFSSTGFVARLDAGGAPDPGFGKNGVVPCDKGQQCEEPHLDASGGVFFGEGENGSHLAYLAPDGSRPPLDSGPSSALLRFSFAPGGRIVELRVGEGENGYNSDSRMQVVEVHADGSAVTGFGEAGSAEVQTPDGGVAKEVFVDPRGRILIAGEAGPKLSEPRSFFVERLRPDGRPDPRFGRGGLVETRVGRRPLWGPMTGALMPDGRLVLADLLAAPRSEHSERFWPNRVELARYLP